MATGNDAVAIVEAAYDLRSPDPLWLEAIVRAAAPLVDDGAGLRSCFFDLNAASGHLVRDPVVVGGGAEWQQRWRTDWYDGVLARFDRDTMRGIIGFAPVAYLTQTAAALARDVPTFLEFARGLARRGWGDVYRYTVGADDPAVPGRVMPPEALNLIAADTTGRGVIVAANRLVRAAQAPTRGQLRRYGRVAAHLVAALRLRDTVTRGSAHTEAVLDPGGRVLHAEGPAATPAARAALRRSVITIDRARTAAVRTQDGALGAWTALHHGRWSILDRFDSDGRRFVVAQPNEPATSRARALSKRELQVVELLALGQTNKLIGYSLGISVSSVSTHIRRVGQKLGMRSTRDLVRWARQRTAPT